MSLTSFNRDHGGENEELLTLSLSSRSLPLPSPPPPPPPPIVSYSDNFVISSTTLQTSTDKPNPLQLPLRLDTAQQTVSPTPQRRGGGRRPPNKAMQPGKSEAIQPPYPWATTTRATVHSLRYLIPNGITTIIGRVQCKRCDMQFDMEYDLHRKWTEVSAFIAEHREDMRDRAPSAWMNPVLPDCNLCQQKNCVKPILSKKRTINWLFLLLGQLIGCCKLSELKYFCKHTKNHRTGAKDRVLYLTYIELCKQLDPQGRF